MLSSKEALERLDAMRELFDIPADAHHGTVREGAVPTPRGTISAWIVTYAWGREGEKQIVELAIDEIGGGVVRWREARR